MSQAPEAVGFPPIADERAQILVLGSMPSIASLDAAEYYAHPKNAFWPIMAALHGFSTDLPYAERCVALRENQVAVWDVLKQCRRSGSLDSAIERDSEVANDFRRFFTHRPRIERVLFNGGKAAEAFRRHVRSGLPQELLERLDFARLPSTSSAHASRSYSDKLRAWRDAMGV